MLTLLYGTVFDNEFIPMSKLGHTKWKHEQGSSMMFKALVEESKLDFVKFGFNFDAEKVDIVINMIEGKIPEYVLV